MARFVFIGEGPTDFAVIENILLGWFADAEEEPYIDRIQPPVDKDGGWTEVKASLLDGRHWEVLDFGNVYIVLQIDTDVCDEVGFDVSKKHPGEERDRTPDELTDAVERKLIEWMGTDFYEQHGDRIIFAIAVDSTECWLLPLLFPKSNPKQQAKTAGCLGAANSQLLKTKRDRLSTGTGRSVKKDVRAYEAESKAYRKQKTLFTDGQKNPSLARLLANLEATVTETPEE